MSDREWRFYLKDMIDFSERVLAYTEDFSREEFVASRINYDATIRNIELIGEAATHIPDQIRRQYSEIPWRQVVAARNQMIHGYLGVDNDILWSLIQEDVPALLEALKGVLEQIES